MNKSTLRIVLSVVSVVVVTGAIVFHQHNRQSAGDAFLNLPQIKSAGNTLTSHGIFERSEYDRLMRIEGEASHDGKASAADIDFVTQTYNKHASSSLNDTLARRLALSTLMIISGSPMPVPERDNIYNIAVPVLSGDVGSTATGAMILGQLKDKRAIPYLLPYLNSPNADVRTCVKFSLRKMGVAS